MQTGLLPFLPSPSSRFFPSPPLGTLGDLRLHVQLHTTRCTYNYYYCSNSMNREIKLELRGRRRRRKTGGQGVGADTVALCMSLSCIISNHTQHQPAPGSSPRHPRRRPATAHGPSIKVQQDFCCLWIYEMITSGQAFRSKASFSSYPLLDDGPQER